MALNLNRGKQEHLGVLTIANTGTESTIMTSDEFAAFATIGVYGPEALTGTVTLEFLRNPTADETVATNWKTAQSPPGTNVEIPAGTCVVLNTASLPTNGIRVVSSGAEGAERVFDVIGARASVTN